VRFPALPRAPKNTPLAASSLASAPAGLFAGTSGWAYNTWKPGFYPSNTPSRAFLHYYASQLTSVEVNYTFRELPTPEQLEGWLNATPPGFRFSFKALQTITHHKRLLNTDDAVADFITSLKPARVASKIGPLLFQLPPNFKADKARLAAFLKTPALKSRIKSTKLQLAFEFRHPTWFTEETFAILRRHNAGLCVAESDDLTTPDVRTADFACFRLRCNGGYSSPKLNAFAERFTALTQQGEVFVYFKHEDEPTGALNALTMLRRAAKLEETGKP